MFNCILNNGLLDCHVVVSALWVFDAGNEHRTSAGKTFNVSPDHMVLSSTVAVAYHRYSLLKFCRLDYLMHQGQFLLVSLVGFLQE